jgi:hypothetical protein
MVAIATKSRRMQTMGDQAIGQTTINKHNSGETATSAASKGTRQWTAEARQITAMQIPIVVVELTRVCMNSTMQMLS